MAKDAYGNPSQPVTATAIDVNYGGAVVDRVVPIYPTTAARDAVITSPTEGQVAYITGDDALTVYNGTVWTQIADPVISDPASDSRTDTTLGLFSDTTYRPLTHTYWYSDTDEVEVTVTTKTSVLVLWKAKLSNSSAGQQVNLSFAVSGASTISASDSWAILYESSNANDGANFSGFRLMTVTAGINTFTLHGKVTGGVGTISRPEIVVIPL